MIIVKSTDTQKEYEIGYHTGYNQQDPTIDVLGNNNSEIKYNEEIGQYVGEEEEILWWKEYFQKDEEFQELKSQAELTEEETNTLYEAIGFCDLGDQPEIGIITINEILKDRNI